MKSLYLSLIACLLTMLIHAQPAWQVVGSRQFTRGQATNFDLLVDHRGTPYVAFQDGTLSNKATVMKFDGMNWVLVGNVGFSSGAVNNLHLAVDKYDSIYVAYSEAIDSNVYVQKFNGHTWQSCGNPNYHSFFVNITIDSCCSPYIVVVTKNNDSIIVKNFSGGNWINNKFVVWGTLMSNPILKIDRAGVLYVGYSFNMFPDPGFAINQFIFPNWSTYTTETFANLVSLSLNKQDVPFTSYNQSNGGPNYAGVLQGTTRISYNLLMPILSDMDIDTASNAYLLFPGIYNYFYSIRISSLTSGNTQTAPYPTESNSLLKLAIDHSNTPSCNTAYIAYTDTGSSYKMSVISYGILNGIVSRDYEEHSISVYPNPNSGQFDILFNLSKTGNYTLEISDVLGRIVYSEKANSSPGQNTKHIDLHSSVPGVYWVSVKDGNNTQVTKMLINY